MRKNQPDLGDGEDFNSDWIDFDDDVEKSSAPKYLASDTLLECLLHIASFHGHETSKDVILSGLSLPKNGLTPGSIGPVAKNAGLQAQTIKSKIANIPDALLPCILLTKNRGCCVLLERDGTNCKVFQPGAGDEAIRFDLEQLETRFEGRAISVKPIYKHVQKDNPSNQYKGHWFWSVLKELKPQYTKVILASLIVNSFAIAAPLFMLNVYDRVLPNSAFSTLWVLAIGMALVLSFDLILRVLRGVIIDKSGRWADVKLASRVMDHVLRIRMSDKPAASGDFASRLREFETVREFFSSGTLLAIIDILFVFLFLLVIYLVAGSMVIIPAVAVVVVVLAGLLVQPMMIKTIRSVQEESALKHGLLIEAINGLDTIKTLNAEGSVLREWQELVDSTSVSTEKIRFLSMNMITFTMIVQQVVTVAIIVYGTYLFDARVVTMGAIIAAVLLASRAVAPLGVVASTLSRLQQSLVALNNLNSIMAMETENSHADLTVSRKISNGNVEFKNVSFSYPQSQMQALSDVSFRINSGDKIGIIGKVGAGKSTLSQLMSGLYMPDEGSVSIDGINIAQLHTSDLRKALGFVLQEPVLFRGTLKENIAYGRPDVTNEEIVRAAEISGSASFINAHPMGFGMPVGERGSFLSGGQRQFVALARALVADPKILLLDEPTSAMDNASEAIFMQKLNKMKDKTLIICTHRQSLLQMVDKLILLDNGKLLAFGPKADVLNFLKESVLRERKAKVQPTKAMKIQGDKP